jgi:hypothetical protein
MELSLPLPARLRALVLWNSAGPFCGKQKAARREAQGTDGHASTGTFQLSDRRLLPNKPPSSLQALPPQPQSLGAVAPTPTGSSAVAVLWPFSSRIPPTSASHPLQHPLPGYPAAWASHSSKPEKRPFSTVPNLCVQQPGLRGSSKNKCVQ